MGLGRASGLGAGARRLLRAALGGFLRIEVGSDAKTLIVSLMVSLMVCVVDGMMEDIPSKAMFVWQSCTHAHTHTHTNTQLSPSDFTHR